MAVFRTSDEPPSPTFHPASPPGLHRLRGRVRGQLCGLFLQDLVRDAGLPVHLHIDELGPGTGDPLSRVEIAVLRLKLLKKKGTAPDDRFALLDSDQAERDPQRADRAKRLAADNGIVILWQEPCFEAVLLRHLVGKTGNRPLDTPGAIKALEKEWAGYEKPMTRANLAKRIDAAAVLRAARVEPGLTDLLRRIGLITAA